MSSRGTGRAWYLRTLRLFFNSIAKSPARAGTVSAASGRVPAWVVVTKPLPVDAPRLQAGEETGVPFGVGRWGQNVFAT